MRACVIEKVICLAGILPVAAHAAETPPAAANAERIGQFITQLGSDRFAERDRAEKELVAIGSSARPRLRAVLKSPDLETARRAQSALAEIERRLLAVRTVGIPQFPDLSDLKSPDPYKRARALVQLSHAGDDERAKMAFPEIVQALDDADEEVRSRALGLYARHAERKAAFAKVLSVVRDERESSHVRSYAIMHLGNFRPEGEQAVPDLLRILRTKDPMPQYFAATALSKLGRNHPDVVPALLAALTDEGSRVRRNAAWTLGELGKEPRRCVPALHERLRRERNLEALDRALVAMGNFGAEAREALPTVIAIANDKQGDDRGPRWVQVRVIALSVVIGISGPAAAEQLKDFAAEGPDTPTGRFAIDALMRLGLPVPEPTKR